MPHLPRRGTGRHQPGAVALHPGWTLTPTSVTDTAPEPAVPAQPPQPTSRWTPAPEPEPTPVVEVAGPPAVANWASEWEAVASTPASGGSPSALHSAAVSTLDAVFGFSAQSSSWGAAPLDLRPVPQPAVLAQPSSALTALDRPLASIPA